MENSTSNYHFWSKFKLHSWDVQYPNHKPSELKWLDFRQYRLALLVLHLRNLLYVFGFFMDQFLVSQASPIVWYISKSLQIPRKVQVWWSIYDIRNWDKFFLQLACLKYKISVLQLSEYGNQWLYYLLPSYINSIVCPSILHLDRRQVSFYMSLFSCFVVNWTGYNHTLKKSNQQFCIINMLFLIMWIVQLPIYLIKNTGPLLWNWELMPRISHEKANYVANWGSCGMCKSSDNVRVPGKRK